MFFNKKSKKLTNKEGNRTLITNKYIKGKKWNSEGGEAKMVDNLESRLIETGYISRDKLDEVRELMKLNDYNQLKLEDVLIDEGYIKEEQLVQILCDYLEIPKIDFEKAQLDYSISEIFSEDFVRKNKILPLSIEKNILKLAMRDPSELLLIDDIENMTGFKVKPFLATSSEILKLTNKIYNSSSFEKEEIFAEIEKGQKKDDSENDLNEIVQKAPIVKLVNMILRQAVLKKASDIHIEPEKSKVRVRFRIDGILATRMVLPQHSFQALISRIKIISDLDITENRFPQDGRIEKDFDGKKIDMRVSTIPTIYGEKIVIRLLKKDSSLLDIDKIGFSKENLKIFKKLIKNNRGIILLTGPTGSGKSTTLFAALNKLNDDSKNIITIEDPVEYKIAGINQIQSNNKIDFTFARALKSILRQDPDIIMLGEIRDRETAKIAIRAALTGHLVLTTLHTNDAVSSVIRLVDMGIPPYLVTSSVIGVVAQRLVRRICSDCKDKYFVSNKEKLLLPSFYNPKYLYRGNKCDKCGQTGYSGRIAVHEILLLDLRIKQMITEGVDETEIRKYLEEKGMKTLTQDAWNKVEDGITTVEEVLRVLNFN